MGASLLSFTVNIPLDELATDTPFTQEVSDLVRRDRKNRNDMELEILDKKHVSSKMLLCLNVGQCQGRVVISSQNAALNVFQK